MQDYLEFRVDLEDAGVVSAYDELPLWSAMFGLLLLEHVPLETKLNALGEARGELKLTIPMAYVEAVRVDAPVRPGTMPLGGL